jgi:hypothetical protein
MLGFGVGALETFLPELATMSEEVRSLGSDLGAVFLGQSGPVRFRGNGGVGERSPVGNWGTWWGVPRCCCSSRRGSWAYEVFKSCKRSVSLVLMKLLAIQSALCLWVQKVCKGRVGCGWRHFGAGSKLGLGFLVPGLFLLGRHAGGGFVLRRGFGVAFPPGFWGESRLCISRGESVDPRHRSWGSPRFEGSLST